MYEVADYTDVNAHGTAILLEAMIERAKKQPFSRLVVASSMSVYGEGLYCTADGTQMPLVERDPRRIKSGLWDPIDKNGRALQPLPTPETKQLSMGSVYALSKYDQERLCLLVGGAYDIPTVALRFFNVYGPNQALSNPYTGVLAIFAARLLNNRPPLIFEDGEQSRDFVYVSDIAEACRLALTTDAAVGRALNIGSGRRVTINEVAYALAGALGVSIEPEIIGECRMGDVRHCFPDISEARVPAAGLIGRRHRETGRLARWPRCH
jgi:dTDP-L-rhamnose 4-epimerase